MLCNNCHSSNVAGARFCSTCGAALSDDYQDVVTKGVEGEDGIEIENENENVYGYDDGFSVKQSDIKEQRKDYEYYPDDNGNQNVGYNTGYNGGYGNNAWNGGYNNHGYNGGYGNNGYNYNNNNAWNAGGNGYNGGYNNGYNYNYNYGYGNTPLRKNNRSVGAIVIDMISGVLALMCLLMTVLPSMDAMQAIDKVKVEGSYSAYGDMIKSQAKEMIKKQGQDTTKNVFQYVNEYLDYKGENKSDYQVTGVIILMMFLLPMIFLLLWAIFSFCRIRAAGSMGIVGAITYIAAGVYWLLFLMNELPIGKFYVTGTTEKVKTTAAYSGLSMDLKDAITVVPYLMIALGVAGIVMSILQVAKRNRVR